MKTMGYGCVYDVILPEGEEKASKSLQFFYFCHMIASEITGG